jgi:DNA-binding NtrC family response regulator
MANILVVDDELGIRALLSEILSDEGHQVDLADGAHQARTHRLRQQPDLVLLDIWMPETDGISLLKEWSQKGQLTMPVIMMSGHGTIDTAVEATQHGALAFLEKPITLQKLLRAVELGLSSRPKPDANRFFMRPGAEPTPQTDHPHGVPSAAPGPQGQAQPGHEASLARPAASQPGVGGVLHGGAAGTGATCAAGQNAALGGSQSLPSAIKTLNLDQPLKELRDEFERSYFEFHLLHENFSMTRVAERTGLERTHLYRKLRQLGMDANKPKRGPEPQT